MEISQQATKLQVGILIALVSVGSFVFFSLVTHSDHRWHTVDF